MKGKKAIDWKEGFSQALIGQRKTSSRKGLMGDSLNLWFLHVLKGKIFMIKRSVCKFFFFLVYGCMCVLFMNKGCVQIKEHGKTLCVTSSDS